MQPSTGKEEASASVVQRLPASGSSGTTGTTTTTHSSSILSEKVSRALQVRTDTPAMKAALDALTQMNNPPPASAPEEGSGDGSGTSKTATKEHSFHNDLTTSGAGASGGTEVVDSRTVRVAIEQDALLQAVALQGALQTVVREVQDLRAGISEIVVTATRVKRAVHTAVITTETESTMLQNNSNNKAKTQQHPQDEDVDDSAKENTEGQDKEVSERGGDDNNDGNKNNKSKTASSLARSNSALLTSNKQDTTEQEQALALALSDAFLKRDLARKRYAAVTAFLEKFDLSQEDGRLLDHYNFEDVERIVLNNSTSQGNTSNNSNAADDASAVVNGMAFLHALERVYKIRQALTQTFGAAAAAGGGGAGASSSASSSSDGGAGAALSLFADAATDSGRAGGSGGGLGASSALRMMEGLAQKQERAYERLYHWLQKYLHLFTSGRTPTNSADAAAQSTTAPHHASDPDALDEALQHVFIKQCLYTLRHVPAFYTHTLELVAGSRRQETTKRFLLALTSGYQGFAPIEMKAHDSVAYVGDMLAFSFRAFSVEADVAAGILHYKPEQDDDEEEENNDERAEAKTGSIATKEGDSKDEDAAYQDFLYAERPITASDMLAISMSGLARPLKSRVLQVVATLSRRPDDHNKHHHRRPNPLLTDEIDDDDLEDDILMLTADEEGAVLRTRLGHLYEICGLLLFYVATTEKGVAKLQRADDQKQQQQGKGDAETLLREETTATITTAEKKNSDDNEGDNDDKNSEEKPFTPQKQHKDNPLVVSLLECVLEATKAFEATVRAYGAMLDQFTTEPPTTAAAALSTSQHHHHQQPPTPIPSGSSQAVAVQLMLTTLSTVRQSSPGFGTTIQDCPVAQVRTLLSMEWVAETLMQAALSNPHACTTLDDVATLKQSIVQAKRAGMNVLAAERLDETLDRKETTIMETLVREETKQVMDAAGLGSLVAAFEGWKKGAEAGGTLMVSHPGLRPDQVKGAMKQFYASLFSPPLPSLERAVRDPALRQRVRTNIANAAVDIYQDLYDSILSSGKGGYEDVTFMAHTPDQVKTLLSA